MIFVYVGKDQVFLRKGEKYSDLLVFFFDTKVLEKK